MRTARLIVADTERDANLLYAVGIFVPDPFIFFEIAGKKHVVMSDLEIDRARAQATVDRVLSLSRYQKKYRVRKLEEVLPVVLREHRVRAVDVPANFPVGLAKRLRGIRVRVRPDPFFPAREIKSPSEIRKLEAALRLAEAGLNAGIRLIRRSRVGRDGWLYLNRQKLRSEDVRGAINAAIARLGGVASATIVAGGNQACDPHEAGHGPLRAHWPVILDIFPRDTRTGYWGDITRTVVRGRASERVREMYATVGAAQQIAFEKLRAGINGREIHEAIVALFKRRGFPTGRKNGRMQGFFHGTGHGLGLEIHEQPRLSAWDATLQAGNVMTVEPGLYYRGTGGVRLEDVVVIGARGARILTRFPKRLEV
jgi:Xaa-Pro aminopeptidase